MLDTQVVASPQSEDWHDRKKAGAAGKLRALQVDTQRQFVRGPTVQTCSRAGMHGKMKRLSHHG